MNAPEVLPAAARLSRDAVATLAEQLAAHFAERIRQRALPPGARLPSVRECARRHALSPSTVVAGYDRLLAAGLVESRRQRGFFVREAAADSRAARSDAANDETRPPLPVSATTLIRGMFQPPGARPMPGLGTLPVDWLDAPMLAGALHKVSRGEAFSDCSLRYGEPAGDARLRQALSVKLAEFGVSAAPEQIVTTVGATQALDIVTRSLLRAGDAVLVDEPGWAVEYARLAALGMHVLPVPRGDEGPDLDVMQRLIDAHRPRLYVTVSVLHNPTGASLSLHRAHQLLRLAEAHELHVVEDDTYAHLAPPHLPRLAALDGLQRTFYISGFSKILAPNWRVGYLAAPRAWVDRLVDTKLLTTLTTPALTERALAHCLEQGLLRRHVERVTQRLDAARARTVRAAESHGFRFAAPPRGLFGWVDAGCDTEALARAMLDRGWLIAPGALFHAVPRPTTLMRVNFATTQDAGFWRELEATCAHISRHTAHGAAA
jgi:DNA-binding transcriptional MocR family regulator